MRQLILMLALLLSWQANAVTCRAAVAATAGGQAGYDKDKKASDAWSQRENQVSSGFEQCLGDLSTMITVPMFPDLSQIFNKITQEVCNAARDKVQQYIPSEIDPWGNIPTNDIPIHINPSQVYQQPTLPTPARQSQSPYLFDSTSQEKSGTSSIFN